MAVLCLASPKGGAGKTTLTLLLGTELANAGAKVCIIDADPEAWIMQWSEKTGPVENLTIWQERDEQSLDMRIEEASQQFQFVIVDLEGSANMMMATTVSMSDLVIIPVRASYMDATGGIRALGLIKRQERLMKRPIPHKLILNSVGAAVKSRDYKEIVGDMDKHNVDRFQTDMVERAAYRAFVKEGGTLHTLDADKVSGVPQAKKNALQFMEEVITSLKALQETSGKAA